MSNPMAGDCEKTENSAGWAFLHRVLDFLAPPLCLGCQGRMLPGDSRYSILCPRCEAKLQTLTGSLLHQSIWRNRFRGVLAELYALYRYHDPVPQVIHAMKYENRRSVAVSLGKQLGSVLLPHRGRWGAGVILPVPLHPARRRERGYNQAELIATGVAEVLGYPVQSRWIRRIRWTPSQVRLSDHERDQNVHGAFAVTVSEEAFYGQTVLLVDDVVTTGSTLYHCAVALKKCGVQTIVAAVIAASH